MKRSLLKIAAIVFACMMLTSVISTAAFADGGVDFRNGYGRSPLAFRTTGTSVLYVIDAETERPVAGAKYDLYRANQFGGKDTKIATVFTDKEGKAIVSGTTHGEYYWVAAAEVKGYAADTEKHAFSIIGPKFAKTTVELTLPVVEEEPAVEEAAIAEEAAEEAPAAEEAAIVEEAPAAEEAAAEAPAAEEAAAEAPAAEGAVVETAEIAL